MIAALSLVTALALDAAPDPCDPVVAAGPRAPSLAAVYRSVGDSERAAGTIDAAAVAYRAALSHDPTDAASRAGLEAVCAKRRGGSFAEGVHLMDTGDLWGAIAAFARARSESDPASAELLEGICLYELGEDEAAIPLLRDAERDPGHRDNARFFLGLIALNAGRSDEAQGLLEKSSEDPSLAPFARDLVRAARRNGRLVFSFMAESGWDSNVDLSPDTSGPTARAGDGMGIMTGVLDLRPLGESGPFVRAIGNYRDQVTYNSLDMLSVGGDAGWQGGRGGRFLLAEYGYDLRELSGSPYLSAHRLFATGRLQLGSHLNAGASWLTRFETFQPDVYAGYSGTHHEATADFAVGPFHGVTVIAGWHGGRDLARDSTLAWWEQGPRLALRIEAAHRLRIGLDGTLGWRRYDALDPSVNSPVPRNDVILDVAALGEFDLADRWTLRVSMAYRRDASNIDVYSYTKAVPMIGLGYTVGLF